MLLGQLLATPKVINTSSALFVETLLQSNLTQLVTAPTRFRTGQNPSLMDLILTNDVNLITSVEYCSPIGISDHCVLETSLQFLLTESDKYVHKVYTKLQFENLKLSTGLKCILPMTILQLGKFLTTLLRIS
jgi:hypothetical protein